MSRGQFCPSRIEVSPQTVAGFADWRIVFVKSDAIIKYQTDVGAEILSSFVYSIGEFSANGAKVHGQTYNLAVRRKLFRVDRQKERPGFVVHF